ncbi:MAG: hypothetical protein ACRC62_00810 [Microcoleus sp.]
MLVWDDASYHIVQEMQQLFSKENDGKPQRSRSITCCLFGHYGLIVGQ